MTALIIVAVVVVALLSWSALTSCTLGSFTASLSVHSQLTGPDAHVQLVGALLTLPGVRLLERNDLDVLLSVLPTPLSLERGFGFFLVARRTADGVVLLGRPRLPLPMNLGSALCQLEREARMGARTKLC